MDQPEKCSPNERVVIIKDTWEPIQWNKHQEYGHICENCSNNFMLSPQWLSLCIMQCILESLQLQQRKWSTIHYTHFLTQYLDPRKHTTYFSVLGSPWTFIPTTKNTHNQPPPRNLPSLPQQMTTRQRISHLPTNYIQSTITTNSHIIPPANNPHVNSRGSNNGWQPWYPCQNNESIQLNPNNISLTQLQSNTQTSSLTSFHASQTPHTHLHSQTTTICDTTNNNTCIAPSSSWD